MSVPLTCVHLTAGLMVAGAAGSLIASSATDARWSQWAALLFMTPSALMASRLLNRHHTT